MMSTRLTTALASNVRTFSTTRFQAAEKTLGESIKDAVASGANKLKNTGSIGSKFEKGGDVAEVSEQVGGPFRSDGAVGKQFSAKEDGVVGGTGQKVAETAEENARLANERRRP